MDIITSHPAVLDGFTNQAPRSVQITKEKILTAALDILIRDGYSTVNIKSIAKELKCSMQPIAWQFGYAYINLAFDNPNLFRSTLGNYRGDIYD